MEHWLPDTQFLLSLVYLEALASPDGLKSREKCIQSVSSIEVSFCIAICYSSIHVSNCHFVTLIGLLCRIKELTQLWLGLRIAKRILVFAPESNIELPDLNQFSPPQMLIDCLQKFVIAAVIRPRIAAGDRPESDLYDLLRSTSASSSPEEVAQVIGEYPITNSIVLLGDPVNHLRVPDAEVIQSLFQDHQKFMFCSKALPISLSSKTTTIRTRLGILCAYLLRPDSRLRLSWRFLGSAAGSTLHRSIGLSRRRCFRRQKHSFVE